MSRLRTNVAHQRPARSVAYSLYSRSVHAAAILEVEHGLIRLHRASNIKTHRERI